MIPIVMQSVKLLALQRRKRNSSLSTILKEKLKFSRAFQKLRERMTSNKGLGGL
jgi:hypothetical protein